MLSVFVFIYLFTVLETIAKLRKATISFVMSFVVLYISLSVCPHEATRLPLDGFLWNWMCVFFENLSTKFVCNSNLIRITETLREDQYTCTITSPSVLLRMSNVSDKSCREKKHILCPVTLYRKFCLWCDNVEKNCRPQIIQYGSFALHAG